MRAEQLAQHLVAHRGYRHRYPENTLRALQAAVEQGITHLEFDIQLTADRVPVLHHDLDLARTCGLHHKIVELSSAQLQRIRVSEKKRLGYRVSPEPIPTLYEVITWAASQPELHLYVEVKEDSVAAFGVQAVLDSVLPQLELVEGRATLISFHQELIAEAGLQWDKTGLVVRSWPPSKAVLSKTRPSVIFVNKRRVMPGRRLDRIGIPVVVYEIDTLKRAQRWLKRGASMLETFSCGELLQDWGDRYG